MKRMIKSLMLIVVASVLFTSCDQKKKELKEFLNQANKECPIALGNGMAITSVALGDDDAVEMKFTVNETIASVSALNNHKEEALETMTMALTKGSSLTVVNKIIDAGVDLRLVFVDEKSGQRATINASVDDLKKAKEKFSNMTDDQKTIVSNVLGMKIKLPFRANEITTLTGLSITSSALVYKFEINDRETGSVLEQTVSLMKHITMSQLSAQIDYGSFLGEHKKDFLKALVNCGQWIKMEYYEINTGARASFEISVSEINDILSGKYQKNALTMEDWNSLGNTLEELDNALDELEYDSVEVYDSVACDYEDDYSYVE